MKLLEQITPLILTYNEEPNILRLLKNLEWAKKVIVIDSYSTDQTVPIVKTCPNVEVHLRVFDTHAKQWNFGLGEVRTEWVLALDADYTFSPLLVAEIDNLVKDPLVGGYEACFKYCVFGRPLNGTILPPRPILFKKDAGVYHDDGHTQALRISGKLERLKNFIYHDDRKSLGRWLLSQDQYATLEVKKIADVPSKQLSFNDSLRKKIFFAPFLVFIYCLIFKAGLFDGCRGWYYAFQRLIAEMILSLRLLEARFKNDKEDHG